MKRNRKMLALAAATMLTVSSSPMAFGAGTVYSTIKDNTDAEKITTLDKYFVMNRDAYIPAATFGFTIVPIEETAAIAADTTNKKLAVLPGVEGVKLYVDNTETGTLSFSANDTAILEDNKTDGDTPVFMTTDTTDEKYVKKTVKINFEGVEFTEPGVYRYIITESGENPGVENGYMGEKTEGGTTTSVFNTKRTLDVYVEDAGKNVENTESEDNGKPMLKIAGYTMYDGEITGAPNANKTLDNPETTDVNEFVDSKVDGATKDASITNIYGTQNLTFAKVVTGNQGSKDKYFKFTVVIKKLIASGTSFTVDVSNADGTLPAEADLNAATNKAYAGKLNLESLVADTTEAVANGYTVATYVDDDEKTYYSITASYYLQNGQHITIKDLPLGTEYEVSEDAEDYTSTGTITAEDSFLNYDGVAGNDAFGDALSGTITDKDIYTGFTNTRSGAIPTGIIASIAGPIILVGVGVVGVIVAFICIKKKKSEEEN